MKLLASAAAGVLCLVFAGAGVSHATSQMLTEAKKAGLPAKNCQYCHTQALPKKDTFKPEALNDRGKFLLSDMQTRNLKAPDIEKLKEFKGAEKK